MLVSCHRCVSKLVLHLSTVIPLMSLYLESKHKGNLECLSRPPGSTSFHFWFSVPSHSRMTTGAPFIKLVKVKHRSWCFISPPLVSPHSWLPPVWWHWYKATLPSMRWPMVSRQNIPWRNSPTWAVVACGTVSSEYTFSRYHLKGLHWSLRRSSNRSLILWR